MLPGNSSVPVSRQPMPRMWLSPSPRILSHTPCSVSSAILQAFQRLEALLEREVLAFLVRPERVGDDAVGAEHDDQPLPARLRSSPGPSW